MALIDTRRVSDLYVLLAMRGGESREVANLLPPRAFSPANRNLNSGFIPMKKIVIGLVAAVVAATSFAGTASAERRYDRDWRGHHGHHYTYVQRDRHRHRAHVTKRVVIRDNGCTVRTVRRVDGYGNVHVRRVRSC